VDGIAAYLATTLPGEISDYDIDHKVPLAGFDLRSDDSVRRAFAVRNHQWLRSGANRSKGARGA